MSLILEALKKSEARRQLGEAPGLGTPFTVARKRRSPLPLILIAIVAAGIFSWYYLGTRPANAPATAPTAPAPSANAAGRAPVRPGSGSVTAQPRPVPPQPPRPGTMPAGRPAPAAQELNAATAGGGEQALRQQRMAAAAAARVAPPDAAMAKPGLPAPTPAASAPKPTVATATPPPLATAVPQPAPAPPTPQAAPQPAAAAAPPAPAAAPVVSSPPLPPVPLYYELPYNVRKDLPPLNVTMHVYATAPAQRFVVVDGDRKAEGETLKDGLTLREIRTDGIILEFRGQQFFYPRYGR